jgi:hypothetical protein
MNEIIVKINQETRLVRDVNCQKTFELFSNNTFDLLFSGDYIPAPVKAELRQEAVAKGLIKGFTSDYQVQAQPPKANFALFLMTTIVH